jgi:hypothetical protein
MSKKLLCNECGKRHEDKQGVVKVLERSEIGEPAEFGRFVRGKARIPDPKQRVAYLNDIPYQLDVDIYNCDMCGSVIKPGDDALCVTYWNEHQYEPRFWEHKFLISIC